jgi:hypothetical protein
MKFITIMLCIAILSINTAPSQSFPPAVTTGIAISNNTYCPRQIMNFPAGCTILPTKLLALNAKRNGTGVLINRKAPDAYGETFFSKVVTIQSVLNKDLLDISPAAARRYTMIKWESAGDSKLTITLFDVAGRFVLCRQYEVKKGMNELLLTNLEALPDGVYSIKASDGDSYRNGKLRIQN